MIRYLKQEEKKKSRPLWEGVFTEDSPSFVDFYYGEKTRKNKILVAEEEDGIAAMLHRNPYEVVVRDRLWRIDYIAGVATEPKYRHQGYMRRLLSRTFSDMYAEQMEFTFLVPASPDIYLPFDFTYISNLPSYTIQEKSHTPLVGRSCTEQIGECKEAAIFAGRLLENEYEVYTKRDEEYYSSLCREVRSADGDVILLRRMDGEQHLVGIKAYYGDHGEELREFFCQPAFRKESAPAKPAVMGRIIHLENFVKVIRLDSDSPASELELMIEVTDPQIRQNNGIFRWRLNKEGSELFPVREPSPLRPHLTLDIASLTSWLFGCNHPDVPEDRKNLISHIRPLRGVYFDEIV